jgi:type IV/VI secretion system ImpK/VasF family protein
LTGGFEEGYGSANSSQAPTEGPDEERAAKSDVDGGKGSAEVDRGGWGPDDEIPHTRRFRAWGAAHERDTPSAWERFVGWLRSLFSRKNDGADEESIRALIASMPQAAHPAESTFTEADDAADEIDGDSHEESAVVVAHDTDALWDEPAVAETATATPPNLAAKDFADIWAPRDESSAEATPSQEPPKKKGFFGRLFTRKDDDESEAAAEERDAASVWASDLAEVSGEPSDLEPADADFADDIAASSAPAEDDFATETSVPAPSLDHSSADSASLAALLGSINPPQPVDDTPTQRIEAASEIPLIEEPILDEAPVMEEPEPSEPPAEPVDEIVPLSPPILEPTRKPGFFSGLLKRVSRTQFIPEEAQEPEPPLMPQASAEVSEVETPPPTPAADSLFETVPTPMPAVPHPAAPVTPAASATDDLDSTLRFPAFRDARDDFAEEEAAEKGRPTEKVEVPAAEEGEKTDEFEMVPPPTAAPETTMETRQVAGFWGRVFGEKAAEAEANAARLGGKTPDGDDKTPFVLAKFRTFYNEVIRDKHQKSDVISGFATAVLSAPASDMADPDFAAQLLSKRLSEMLELQAAESNWTGGDAAKYYLEAQYAMVALADETFATIDWPGRSSWHKHMLEPRMYGTRGADIEFFKRIDKLLKDPSPEKGARDLARLYLMVIASGFRGKFRVPKVKRPLAEYRRRLYEFSHAADPLELYARDRRIFTDATAHTIESRAGGRFTPAQKWMGTAIVLLLLYLGISHYAWSRLSADLKDIMTRIESPANPGKTP